jgi:hypothetical protein
VNCLFCQKGPAQGVSLFRVNAKGQPGVWACERHIGQTDAAVDAEVRDIAAALSNPSPASDGDQG